MNIVNKRLYYFIAVALISVICIVALAVQGLNRGVDFQAGTQLTISFTQNVTKDQLKTAVDDLGFKEATVSLSSSGHYYVQTRQLSVAETEQLQSDLTAKLGALTLSYESIPQNIASQAIRMAVIAIVIAIAGMLIYIAFAFRRMPNPFKFGICAVAGLAFDILVTLGAYSIFGGILNWSIDLMFVAGILAVLGYSVNNTIIVFDRIRENSRRGVSTDIEIVANASIAETLGRSFNSSLTVLITLFALLIFVGSSIQNFVIVLIIGTISGVITSTFLSPELLVSWQKKSWGSFSGKSSGSVVKSKA
jgi:preprotein translocase subunit SecF